MKLKEKPLVKFFTNTTSFVPKSFDSKTISRPSRDFMETVKGIKILDFVESSPEDFANLCKLNIPKKR